MIPFSFGAFLVWVAALSAVVLIGFWGLIETGHPFFLPVILLGLFYFYLGWEATVGRHKQ